MKLGFVVNPIAGMGGKVGLKGTDGMVEEAIKRGATKEAPQKAIQFLKELKDDGIEIYTASGEMGEYECREAGIKASVVYMAKEKTNAKDTINACKQFLKHGIHAIAFVGGDGTARDVYNAVGKNAAIIGIPAGVKMYSGVFALTPQKAAEVIKNFNGYEEREIADIDEDAFRKGQLKIKIFGYALTFSSPYIQYGKDELVGNGKEEIAEYIIERMEDGIAYIIGSGSTTYAIKKALGIDGSFLGIDVIKDGKLVIKDANEEQLLNFLSKNKARIIISPLGGNGFIFGRGNQQISWKVIKKVGKDGIIIVATPQKLAMLKKLHVDTGNEEINEMLRGYVKVIVGYNEVKVMRVI